ncbi:MAG TPA: tetratricopeptide repeat protein [Verrucomicrobiae bacterium]|nr:tetratricopeptide repeat protein [Verrucomicrobiae bacterium]
MTLVVYGNNLHGPFILDDVPWILNNPNIRALWPVWKPLVDTSRPVVQWSLAVNFALGGLNPVGYHIINNLIHALTALAVFGVVRRTLRMPRLFPRFGESADGVAFAIVLLWALHSLDTESVTYVIQRAESMAGLFAVLTLYCVIRGAATGGASAWDFAAMFSCALAVGSKPVAAVVPFLVLAYDGTFLAGTWSEPWRKRAQLYVGLGASWLLAAAFLVAGRKEWMGSAGVVSGARAIPWVDYAMLQPQVIVHYLRLSLWPDNLCLLYGPPQQLIGLPFWLCCAVVGALLVLTAYGLVRRNVVGFLGAWFFVTLAPTSVIPLLHPVFEHRMYLPLMAVVAGIVCGVYWLIGNAAIGKSVAWVSVGMLVVGACALGATTMRRNMDYRTEVSIWRDTAQKAPTNPDAQYGLALALATAGRVDEADAAFGETMRLRPDFAQAEYDWGRTLEQAGREAQAIEHFTDALRINPQYGEAENGIGVVLYHQGKLDEAIRHFFEATRLNPNDAQAQQNLVRALHEQQQGSGRRK